MSVYKVTGVPSGRVVLSGMSKNIKSVEPAVWTSESTPGDARYGCTGSAVKIADWGSPHRAYFVPDGSNEHIPCNYDDVLLTKETLERAFVRSASI